MDQLQIWQICRDCRISSVQVWCSITKLFSYHLEVGIFPRGLFGCA